MHRYGVLSFTDVIVKSSNVGAIKVGLRLGPERLTRYVSRFGFGQTLVAGLPRREPGDRLEPADLDESALASVSMGYQVGVTPLQMAAAVSSVANGGTLFEPRIVRAMVKDGRATDVAPKALRRTITERTAADADGDDGSGRRARHRDRREDRRLHDCRQDRHGAQGHRRRLLDTDYNASFVGFVPSRKPALTIIVVIDSPHGKGYYGGVVAAPIFQRIAEAALRHLGIPPTINAPPPVLVARHAPTPRPPSRCRSWPPTCGAALDRHAPA